MDWQNEIGKFVTNDGGQSIWQVIGYCDQPTVILESCLTKERINTGIGGLLAHGWARMVPEKESEL